MSPSWSSIWATAWTTACRAPACGRLLHSVGLLTSNALTLAKPHAKLRGGGCGEASYAPRADQTHTNLSNGRTDAVLERDAALRVFRVEQPNSAFTLDQNGKDVRYSIDQLDILPNGERNEDDDPQRAGPGGATDVRSPVDGISTASMSPPGAVVTAGSRLLDMVPKSDFLLVEAKLRPADVAFVISGQLARIEFTAYDFSVYGGLDGIVENVSADSLVDKKSRETYLVTVRAEQTSLTYRGQELAILPGSTPTFSICSIRSTKSSRWL